MVLAQCYDDDDSLALARLVLWKRRAPNGYSIAREGHYSGDRIVVERAPMPYLARPLGVDKVCLHGYSCLPDTLFHRQPIS